MPDERPGRLADRLPPAAGDDCVVVEIDGVDGSGKTTLADRLAAEVAARGRPTVRVSLDDFHRPAAERHARGRASPEGFWLDSFDYVRFRTDVLEPLGPGGDRAYRPVAHDVSTDATLHPESRLAPPGAVVIVDGLFLHRDELLGVWDVSVFLDVPFAVSCARMALRDGSPADPGHPANARYVNGQRLYLAACRPRERATVVLDGTDQTS